MLVKAERILKFIRPSGKSSQYIKSFEIHYKAINFVFMSLSCCINSFVVLLRFASLNLLGVWMTNFLFIIAPKGFYFLSSLTFLACSHIFVTETFHFNEEKLLFLIMILFPFSPCFFSIVSLLLLVLVSKLFYEESMKLKSIRY